MVGRVCVTQLPYAQKDESLNGLTQKRSRLEVVVIQLVGVRVLIVHAIGSWVMRLLSL